ncbi:MAG: hypothetical protein AB1453_03900 [Chloroflexota bacterium]|jgi:hypothetical protein
MHIYEVGKPYTERTSWPELAQYSYRGGEHELIIFLNCPTRDEVYDIRRGGAEFALYVERRLIVMLYRFGEAIPWSDAPYSIHLVPVEERTVPEISWGSERALLHIVLVDASSGIIRALRVLSMTEDFTRDLHQSICNQADEPFTRADYNGALESLYARFSSKMLVELALARFNL